MGIIESLFTIEQNGQLAGRNRGKWWWWWWFLQKFTEQNQPDGQSSAVDQGWGGAAVLGGEKKFRVESFDDDLLLKVGNGFRKRNRAL